jgi:hypothetical protein
VPDAEVFAHGSRRWLPPTALAGRRRRPAGEAGAAVSGSSTPRQADDRI